MAFKNYKQFDLQSISEELLKEWQKEHLFEKSIEIRQQCPSFLFFEGPPSANGKPGIHHVLSRSIKDAFCRYKTMQGFCVQRKAGWDTHGLPVELGVEKQLNITKEDIGKKISVQEYNAACRKEVMKYTKEWSELTQKMGYWIDLENPYITYDNKYIESVWYLLKELYKKGYLYKGYTIQPYSPAAGTGLSSHELNQPGCYRDVKDTTCTAQFLLTTPLYKTDLPIYALAWTTTPWTLPSNTALCVNPKITYTLVEGENPYTHIKCLYLLAEECLKNYTKELGEEPTIVQRYTGKDLAGTLYEPLIDWITPEGGKPFQIILGDYVTTEEGTGIVHIAPTFGADDAFVAKQADVPGLLLLTKKGELRPMVDMTGKYFMVDDLDEDFVKKHVQQSYYEWQGRFVKNAYDPNLTDKDETLDVAICMLLKQNNKVFRIEKHTHNYPHCWRTDKPILYYPLDSWFIKTSNAKERMFDLNTTIHWHPESTGTGRFGKWLENLNDWNLSRSRYWGTPLPIWRTEDGKEEKCIGSVAELFEEIEKSIAKGFMKENPWKSHKVGDYSAANYAPEVIDLHRPYVDEIILVSDSGKPMKRELDLIDVWFDSGAMPYAQNHFPFENKSLPITADFICEGVDQTRGWFYTLHAIHTMIDDTVAFRNVISNGLVLDKNGNKMSKRLGNSVDPFEMIDQFGADCVRWYMLTNSSPWDNLKFDPEGVAEMKRKFFGTLYNTYSFFALYANVDQWQPTEKAHAEQEIDKWILSKLHSLIAETTDAYENYDVTRAGRAISDFVQNDLSNWYVRLNRKRYWGNAMNEDKQSAFYVLYTCLVEVARLMAPIAPFYSDILYRDLVGQTVHLADFPKADKTKMMPDLEYSMSLAQQVTSIIFALRKRAEKNVRQPLQKAVIPVHDQTTKEALLHHKTLIETETNIKELWVVAADKSEIRLVKKIKPQFKILGKKVGGKMKDLANYIATMTQDNITAMEQNGQWECQIGDFNYTLLPEDVEIITEDMPGWLVANEGNLTVALDIEQTQELIEEGIAREIINRIQNLRKEIDLQVTDRIVVQLQKHPKIDATIAHFNDYIASQILATKIELCDSLSSDLSMDLDGETIVVKISK